MGEQKVYGIVFSDFISSPRLGCLIYKIEGFCVRRMCAHEDPYDENENAHCKKRIKSMVRTGEDT